MDKYADKASLFSDYLQDFFNPGPNHTTWHFGYKPVFDIIRAKPNYPHLDALDIGCGAGHFVTALRQQGINAIGMDASSSMLQKAKANFPDSRNIFYPADDETLNKKSYDLMTMNFVISEVGSPKKLEEMFSRSFQLLADKGSLIILTNNLEDSPQGAHYVTWTAGVTDTSKIGSPFTVVIHEKDVSFELTDYYWSKDFVTDKLKQAGFNQIETFCPTLADVEQKNGWMDEGKFPPTRIYQAFKP